MSPRTIAKTKTHVVHRTCGGKYHAYVIEPFGFEFLRCGRCAHFWGGDATLARVRRMCRELGGRAVRLW